LGSFAKETYNFKEPTNQPRRRVLRGREGGEREARESAREARGGERERRERGERETRERERERRKAKEVVTSMPHYSAFRPFVKEQ